MLFRNLVNALVLLLFSMPLIIVILLLEEDPIVVSGTELTQQDLEAVQDFLVANDPRTLFDGEVQNVILPEAVADSLLKYLASEASELGEINTEASFLADEALIELSIPVNGWILGNYVNIRVTLDEGALPARIRKISLGTIELPHWLVSESLKNVLKLVDDQPEARTMAALLSGIHQVTFAPGTARFLLQLSAVQMNEVSNNARDMMLTTEQQDRVVEYYQALLPLEQQMLRDGNPTISLNLLFNELFSLAYDNVLAGEDAATENRAVFLAMTVFLTDLTLDQVAKTSIEPNLRNHTRKVTVFLNGRKDLATHVVTSAAIAAHSGRDISRVISVYKEVVDSQTESGFSFDDMIANTVGTALGEIATSTQSTAHRLQNVLRDVASESDYMPAGITGTSLSEDEFTAIYGSRHSEAYLERMSEIEMSISELPLFQNFSRDIEVRLAP